MECVQYAQNHKKCLITHIKTDFGIVWICVVFKKTTKKHIKNDEKSPKNLDFSGFFKKLENIWKNIDF